MDAHQMAEILRRNTIPAKKRNLDTAAQNYHENATEDNLSRLERAVGEFYIVSRGRQATLAERRLLGLPLLGILR